MKKYRPNFRLVKTHLNYEVREAARLLGTHPNTVLRWVRDGLPLIDNKRPFRIHGQDLFDFLKARRSKNKQTCKFWEIFCLSCRSPRTPAGDMADYQPSTPNLGCLIGICPHCGKLIYRSVNPVQLEKIRSKLEIRFTMRSRHIVEMTDPLLNSDLQQAEEPHAKTQPQ